MSVEWKNSCTTQQLPSIGRKLERLSSTEWANFFCQGLDSKYFQLRGPYCLCHNYSILPLCCESKPCFYRTLFTKKRQWAGFGLWDCTLCNPLGLGHAVASLESDLKLVITCRTYQLSWDTSLEILKRQTAGKMTYLKLHSLKATF